MAEPGLLRGGIPGHDGDGYSLRAG